MKTATNPQTGETLAYVNGQWVPLPTGGLSFDRLRGTTPRVTPLDDPAIGAPAEDLGLGGQFVRSFANAFGPDTAAGLGGALQSFGFEETGQALRDWGEENALPPVGIRSIDEIDEIGDIPSYVANMAGMALGSSAIPAATGAVGAVGGSVVPVVGTVAGGLLGAFGGSYAINEGHTYNQIRQAMIDNGATEADAHATASEIAIPLGLPIAAMDVFALSRALPFLRGGVRDAAQDVVEEAAKRGLIGTAARRAGVVGLAESGTETGQTILQDMGQAAVDPNYQWNELPTRLFDSAAAGLIGGGMFGVAGAPSARGAARTELARRDALAEMEAARAAAIETRDTQNRVIDAIAGEQRLLPPPDMTPEQRRREDILAPARTRVSSMQDNVTAAEARLAAHPGPVNETRLANARRWYDEAAAEYQRLSGTDIFATGEVEPHRIVPPVPVTGAPEAAPAAAPAPPPPLPPNELLRIKIDSLDRAIKAVKAQLKTRPTDAPSIAKLAFLDQQRAAAVAALGPNPAEQLAGKAETIRALPPGTDPQDFAREIAKKIQGDADRWVPIQEKDGPVTGYINYQTGEIRTPEQHLAPIPTPLSGRDPTVTTPEDAKARATAQKEAAAAAEKALQDQRDQQAAIDARQKEAAKAALDAVAARQRGEEAGQQDAQAAAPAAPPLQAPEPAKPIPYETLTWIDNGDGSGRTERSGGAAPIVDLSDRKIVVRDVNGVQVPFWLSTGQGGKKGVPAGKWYPFPGLASGWINKASDAEIANYYGSPELRAAAERLDAEIGDIRGDTMHPRLAASGPHVDFLNQGVAPVERDAPGATDAIRKNMRDIIARIEAGRSPAPQGATETVAPAAAAETTTPSPEPAAAPVPAMDQPGTVAPPEPAPVRRPDTQTAARLRQSGQPVASPRAVGREHQDVAILPDGTIVTAPTLDDEDVMNAVTRDGVALVTAPAGEDAVFGTIMTGKPETVTPEQRDAINAIRRENARLPFDEWENGKPRGRVNVDPPARSRPKPPTADPEAHIVDNLTKFLAVLDADERTQFRERLQDASATVRVPTSVRAKIEQQTDGPDKAASIESFAARGSRLLLRALDALEPKPAAPAPAATDSVASPAPKKPAKGPKAAAEARAAAPSATAKPTKPRRTPLMAAMARQEELERVSAKRSTLMMSPSQKNLLERQIHAAAQGRNSAVRNLRPEETALFDRWRADDPGKRQSIDELVAPPLPAAAKPAKKAAPKPKPDKAMRPDEPGAQVPQTETAAFKRWFGDSKVVDANGEPLVVYHGTANNIRAFSPKMIGRNYGVDRKGFFFTSSPDAAAVSADDAAFRRKEGQNIIPAFLSIKRPLEVRNTESGDAIGYFDRHRNRLLDEAEKAGADGIIVRGEPGDGDMFVAFEPTQIKSAVGNRGTYDPNNPDIRAMRPDEGAAAAPEGHAERIAKAETDIRAMLKRMTGRDVPFRVTTEPLVIDGQVAVGGFNTAENAIVISAMSDSGHAYSRDQMLGIARHEAIHWMRENNMLPRGSWAALERAAPQWMKRFKIAERYGDLTAEQQREEAIAEAYRAWAAGKLRLRGGPIQTAFEFIRQFLRSIRNVFHGQGFIRAEDIFAGIERGDFAAAENETAGPTNIARDSEWMMLRVGPTPAPSIILPIEESMRAARAAVWGANKLFGDTKTARAIGSVIDRARTALQYTFMNFQRAEEAYERTSEQPLPDEWRTTLAETFITGKVGHWRNEKDRLYYEPIMEMINKHNIPLADVGNYLLAKHAAERNAQIAKINPLKDGTGIEEVNEIGPDGKPVLDAKGKPKKIKKKIPRDGSGITDEEAASRLRALEAKPYAPQLAEIQRLVVEMNNRGLDVLVEGGRTSAESVQRMKEMYPNYVNLSGIEDPDVEHDPDGNPETGRGYMGTRGTVPRRATGRWTEPTDILANSFAEFDARVIRAETNLIRQTLLTFAGNAPDPNLWTIQPVERRAIINKQTGQVHYTMMQDVGADVVFPYVDGVPYAVRFNTKREIGREMYRSFAKLDGIESNKVFTLMMRANMFLSRMNTTWNPEFMFTAIIKDLQEAGINLQQYGVQRVAQKAAGHLPSAMKAAWRYMNHKELGTGWDAKQDGGSWTREFAAAGGITYFADRTTPESYVKKINSDLKAGRGPLGMTWAGVKSVFGAVERTNNAADMGTRLAAYRTLREAGMSKPRAIAAAKNLTVNFNRKGSYGPAMNALFMFFNASIQGTATMLAAVKNSKVVKGLVLGVVATGIIQELALSLLSPPDPDDPSRTVYDAIPEYVKQRNLILWVDDDGSYGTFPKPWGYGFFHDVGRVMTRYLRGAPMGVGRPATVLDTVKDMGVSFIHAFVPPGFDAAVPSLFSPLVEVATNKDYAGRSIAPARMPGDKRPDSQMYYPGESWITVETAALLNRITGGDAYRPGIVDISPEGMSHVVGAYGGAAVSFYTRAANTLWGAGAEALGFNRQDPDLDWNDVPFVRRGVGNLGSWQVRDLTYQRIADVELLEDEIAGYQEQGDRDRARELRAENGPLVALAKEGRRVRRALGELRRERQAILDGPLSAAEARSRIDALDDREDRLMSAWNAKYVRAQTRVADRAS